MLQGVLERVLLNFLAPYVDGIDIERLHVGVLGGHLELKDLQFKKEVPALVGFEDFRVTKSRVGLIKVSVPWKALLRQEIRVIIDVVHLEVEHIASGAQRREEDVLSDMRKAKAQVVDLRTQQLRELLLQQEQEATDDGGKSEKGFAKTVRKIIENLQLEFSDMNIALASKGQGLAWSLQLPALSVLSADQNFQRAVVAGDAGTKDSSLFKMLRLQKLGLKMAPAGNSDLNAAEYILTPISVELNFAHVPRTQTLQFRLEVAAKEQVAFRMMRSQCKHVLRIMAENAVEKERLQDLLVPAAVETRVLGSDGGKAAQEAYYDLFRRRLFAEKNLQVEGGSASAPLTSAQIDELALLEDALPVLFLARQRLKVLKEFEALEQYRTEREKAAKKESNPGFLSRMFGRRAAAGASNERAPLMTEDELTEFMAAVHECTAVEDMELPKRYKLDILLGTTAVDLIDDRWSAERDQQILRASLTGAQLGIGVAMKADHKGNDSAEWKLEARLLSLSARQHGLDLIAVNTPEPFAAATGGEEQGGFVALLVVESMLQAVRNLLRLTLETKPLELNWQPSFYSPILDFVRAPEVQRPASVGALRPATTNYESLVDLSQQVLETYGSSAKTAAAAVYERLPDAIGIEVRLASPIFRVPVEGQGTTTISLGRLLFVTPSPCVSGSFDFNIDLTDTMISARSLRGERFDLVQPTPVAVRMSTTTTESRSSVNIQVQMEELQLTLAPQAMSILMGVPAAFTSAPAKASESPTDAGGALEVEAAQPAATKMMTTTETLMQDIAFEGSVLAEALDAAKLRALQVAAMQLVVDLGFRAKRFEVTLSDSIVPVMRCHTDLLASGFTVNYSSNPRKVKADLEHAMVEVELLNQRHGRWEPLVERFDYSFGFTQQLDNDCIVDNKIVLGSYGPLLLNATPTAVRSMGWFLPLLASGLRGAGPQPAEKDGGEAPAASPGAAQRAVVDGVSAGITEAKYRVVNLCEEPLVLNFQSPHKQGLRLEVPPTGSSWRSMDDLILPNFAQSLTVQRCGGDAAEASAPLPLDRGTGAVAVPGLAGVFAELSAPHPSHRVLLLSSALRVHNRTDLLLRVRFHADARESTVCSANLTTNTVCDGALLGFAPATCRAGSFARGGDAARFGADGEEGLLLGPNAMCAVPASMYASASGAAPRAWLSFRPAAVESAAFCSPFSAGLGAGDGAAPPEPKAVVCPGQDGDYVGFMSYASIYETPSPACARMSTLVLQPLLTFVNAVPVADIWFGLSAGNSARWFDTKVGSLLQRGPTPNFERWNIYRYPGDADAPDVRVRLRLGEAAPWSEVASYPVPALASMAGAAGAPEPYEVELRKDRDGGAAGIHITHAGPFMLRAECPNWLSDRSGVGGDHVLQVRHRGAPLPSIDGITLMPANCMEEDCELHFCRRTSAAAAASVCSTSFRVPAGWGMLTLQAPSGDIRLCLQAEPLAAHDVLGAQCQVLWLRPRMVLTNSSESDIEVRSAADGSPASVVRVGESIVWHWKVARGSKDDANQASVRFRPLGGAGRPSWQWSAPIVCTDAAVGSTPLMMLPEGASADFDIWSADVASERGALSIAFRLGSDFVAKNDAERSKVLFKVRPSGAPRTIAVMLGEEACYGWTGQGKSRAASVFLERPADGDTPAAIETMEIPDVQATVRLPVPSLGVSVVVKRSGDTVLLCLEDSLGTLGSLAPSSDGVPKGSRLRLEVKLERLGVSFVEELPAPRELLYIQLEPIRIEVVRTENDTQVLRLQVSEAQVDCQLPGRVDRTNRNTTNVDGEKLGWVHRANEAVLFSNRGGGNRSFLALDVTRVSTSSRDFLLPSVDLAIDAVDATLDDEWLEHFRLFVRQATMVSGDQVRSMGAGGAELEHVLRLSGQSILVGYTVPLLPSVVQLEKMKISAIDLTVWCSIALRNLNFLPPTLRYAVMILSLSGKLTLDGAELHLEQREIPPHRGSTKEFLGGLANQYAMDLMSQSAAVLGRSSLANVPRVPIRVGGTGLTFCGETFTKAVDDAASLLEHLTFDNKYIERQKEIRSRKRISGAADGVAEASAAIGQGLYYGLTDVVAKPVSGFNEEGVAGFFKGAAQGVVGVFVKPVTGIGQGISNLGQGITAQVGQLTGTSTSQTRRFQARVRTRLPRMLYCEQGAIRRYSDFDAEVRRQLGRRHTHGVEVVLPCAARDDGTMKVLLLLPTKLLVCEVKYENGSPRSGSGEGLRPPTSSSSQESSWVSHALRPIHLAAATGTMVMDTFAGPGGLLPELTEDPGDPEVCKRTEQFELSKIREVRLTGQVLQLKDVSGRVVPLPIGAANLGPAAKEALVAGFTSAASGPTRGLVDWTPLVAALMEEERGDAALGDSSAPGASPTTPFFSPASSSSALARAPSGRATPGSGSGGGVKIAGGSHTLEVFELQSRIIGTYFWQTPFLPTDIESSWRWVDASGNRHPNIRPGMSKEQVVNSDVPPCELSMYAPRGSWKLRIDGQTDKEGWMYAVHWKVSTWNSSPGWFDAVRKRRWTREFA